MKLHYFQGGGPLRVLVLEQADRRIELHIRPLDEQAWALVALSGHPQQQPTRHRCQGPYVKPAQAEAALRAIAAVLLEQGYRTARQLHPVWGVAAQRLVRGIRDARAGSAGAYVFEPDQHEPLW